MKFIEKNEGFILSVFITLIFINNLNGQVATNKNKKKYDDDFPTVMALSPEADLAVKIGNKFCSENCVTDLGKRTKTCILNNKPSDCKRCTINPKFKKDKQKTQVCENFCNGILPSKPCNFYGYFNGKLKKAINGNILKKFKLQLIRRR